MIKIRRENWKGRYVYVARENGKILSSTRKTDLRINQLKDLFRRNRSFSKDIRVKREKLKKVTEIVKTRKSKIIIKDKRKTVITKSIPIGSRNLKVAQYVVTGVLKSGQEVSARSQRIGSPLAKTKRQAISNAWSSFYQRLDHSLTGDYDEGDGKDLFQSEVVGVREGWVYYK